MRIRRITEPQQAGVIEQPYLKADRSGAVIILEAEGARRPLATLPPVALGVTSFDVSELAPAQSPRIEEHPRARLHGVL